MDIQINIECDKTENPPIVAKDIPVGKVFFGVPDMDPGKGPQYRAVTVPEGLYLRTDNNIVALGGCRPGMEFSLEHLKVNFYRPVSVDINVRKILPV